MKNITEPHRASSGSAKSAPFKAIRLWILLALVANALLLCVIALQLKQVGHQLASLARQGGAPALPPYAAYAEIPLTENPYYASFAKNNGYSAYRAASSDPIPVRIVGTPLPVTVENTSWDAVPVEIKK